MEIRPTALTDVKILVPQRFGDARGFFSETWNALRMRDSGLDIAFVQDNESLSAQVGTRRGLHCQAPPFAQAKLVRVVQGAILDVAVDMRRGSPDFGRWIAEVISADNGAQILVPRGFLHGFVTLAPDTLVQYKVDNGFGHADSPVLKWAPLFVIAAFFLRGFFNFSSTYGLNWIGGQVVMHLRQQVFEHLLRMPVPYYDQNSTGTDKARRTYSPKAGRKSIPGSNTSSASSSTSIRANLAGPSPLATAAEIKAPELTPT